MVAVSCKALGHRWMPLRIGLDLSRLIPILHLRCSWCGTSRLVEPPRRERIVKIYPDGMILTYGPGGFGTLP